MSENGNKYKLIDILIVEDDNDHARLIVWALKSLGWLQNNIIHLNDGQKAINYMRKTGEYSNSNHKLPELILLDIKMPVKDGFEVLEDLKADSKFNKIPIVILSTTYEPSDIEKAMKLGVVAFIRKTATFEELKEKMDRMGNHWGLLERSETQCNS